MLTVEDGLLETIELLTELDDELLSELELTGTELLLSELLLEVTPQAATTPKGAGWLVQVEREIQLLLFS